MKDRTMEDGNGCADFKGKPARHFVSRKEELPVASPKSITDLLSKLPSILKTT